MTWGARAAWTARLRCSLATLETLNGDTQIGDVKWRRNPTMRTTSAAAASLASRFDTASMSHIKCDSDLLFQKHDSVI